MNILDTAEQRFSYLLGSKRGGPEQVISTGKLERSPYLKRLGIDEDGLGPQADKLMQFFCHLTTNRKQKVTGRGAGKEIWQRILAQAEKYDLKRAANFSRIWAMDILDRKSETTAIAAMDGALAICLEDVISKKDYDILVTSARRLVPDYPFSRL